MVVLAGGVRLARADDPTPAPADAGAVVVDPIDVRAARLRRGGTSELTSADQRTRDADRALEDPAFVTVVHIDERSGETATIAEVLAKSVGVSVRSLGGLGAFSSLSVRGSPSGHTMVLIDGVPVSRVATVTADVGRFELGSFSELELYRGGVPAYLGGAALGGALNLVTRVGRGPDGERLSMSAGIGSFGARHLRAQWGDGAGGQAGGYRVSVGYAGATGDYVYFNDNGTNLNPTDDAFVARTNNGYDQLDAQARWRSRRGDVTFDAGARSLWKSQGIAGSASVQSENTSLATLSQLIDGNVIKRRALGSDKLVARAGVFVMLERQRYRDLDGEVGLAAQNRRYVSVSVGARGGLEATVTPAHRLAINTDAQLDYFTETDVGAAPGERARTKGSRLGVGAALADEWSLGRDDRVVIQPALRLDVLRTDPIEDSNSVVVGMTTLSPRTELAPSPRVSVRARLREGLVAKANGGYYFRAPTLLELFGDRGYVVGNPGLVSETGLSGDAGLVWAPSRGYGAADRVRVELVGFASRPRDVIALVPTAGLATVAQNLSDARLYGAEVSVSTRLARTVTMSTNYTRLQTVQSSTIPSYDGKQLPQRPQHQLYGRVDVAREVRGRQLSAWLDTTLVSGNFLDPANITEVPARRFFGTGIKLEPVPALLIGVEVKNIANNRVERITLEPPPRPDLTSSPKAVAEVFGYPLPGRAFYLTVSWRR